MGAKPVNWRPMKPTKLSPEDQARVDSVTRSGYNTVERAPFRPFRLLLGLIVILTVLSLTAVGIAYFQGVI